MALRIGKKNNADDWSEESLRQELAQISNQPDDASAASSTPAEDDPLADFMADFPDDSTTSASAPVASPAVTTDASVEPAADVPEPVPVRRPKVSPVLLAAGLVFLIVAAAVGIWLAFFSTPTEDTEAPVVVAQKPRPAVVDPQAPPPATKVIQTPPKKIVPPRKVVPPNTPVRPVAPGKAGITAQNAKPPAVAPKKPGAAPRVVPVQGVPTPVVPPPGMAGQPGKGSTQVPTVRIVRPTVPLTPALQQRLKALWNQGAAAKHRGDYAGARRAWQEILRIRPGHPGIQEAIDKLPR